MLLRLLFGALARNGARRGILGQAVGSAALLGAGATVMAPEAVGSGISRLALRTVTGMGSGLASSFNEVGQGIAEGFGLDEQAGSYIGAGLGVAATGLLSGVLGAGQNPLGTLATIVAMVGVAYAIVSQSDAPEPSAPAMHP